MSKECGLGQWVSGSVHVSMSTMSVCVCLCDPVSGHAMFKEPFVQLRPAIGIGAARTSYLTHSLKPLVKVMGAKRKNPWKGQYPSFEGQQMPEDHHIELVKCG